MRSLIVTADDFGADISVNDAVEHAHRHGILTAASLMVSGAAAADAVARARAMPALGLGLHLVLVDGTPMLPATQVPDLVDGAGRFRANMAAAGVNFLRPKVRRQLAAEIEAQFAAFAATGLPLDHVNAHKHFHLHPTILSLVLTIGRRFGLAAMRAPVEPLGLLRRVEPVAIPLAGRIARHVAEPWARLLGGRARRAGLTVPDRVFGLAWSGAIDARRLGGIIAALPPGLTEIYLHPATDDRYPGHAPGYRYRDELAALTDATVAAEVTTNGARLVRFADMSGRTGA